MPTVAICTSCKAEPASPNDDDFAGRLSAALEDEGLAGDFEVVSVGCMNVCAEPVTVALQGWGMATCVFAGVSPHTDIADLVATCRTYLESPAGWIDDARACGRLRFCLKARVPAL